MELTYIKLDFDAILERLNKLSQSAENGAAVNLPFVAEIPLPYILRAENAEGELDWNSIVDGILYVGLYEPKHEHRSYYKDFLLALAPELPHILQENLRDHYEQRLWQHAHDTIGMLLFLLPEANWPLLELCYSYEQAAEEDLIEQHFAACTSNWGLAFLGYKQLLERDDINAECYFQLAHYYLQCWNYPAAYQAFISCQQLALSPEHALWAKCHEWLQKIHLFAFTAQNSVEDKIFALCWARIWEHLQNALAAEQHSQLQRHLWLEPLADLNKLLRAAPDCAPLWYLRGLCLLYGHDPATLRSLNHASLAFAKTRALGWSGPLRWEVPYYLGLSHYLEGSYRDAERHFLEVLQDNTEHCATLYWLEKIYEDLEDAKSLQYQELLQNTKPSFPDLLQSFL